MTAKFARLTVTIPPELFSEIEAARDAMNGAERLALSLSAFSAMILRRGLDAHMRGDQ
jgi:hypothetical protein